MNAKHILQIGHPSLTLSHNTCRNSSCHFSVPLTIRRDQGQNECFQNLLPWPLGRLLHCVWYVLHTLFLAHTHPCIHSLPHILSHTCLINSSRRRGCLLHHLLLCVTYTYVCIYIYIRTYAHTFLSMYMYIYVCTHCNGSPMVLIHMWGTILSLSHAHTHAHAHTNTQDHVLRSLWGGACLI